MNFLLIAIAPVVIIAVFIWFRDKYEREPIGMCLKALLLGAFICAPIYYAEVFLSMIALNMNANMMAFYNAFIVAAFTEEAFKYLAVLFLIWKNVNFNEKFDGIVYAVFVSLGFAMVENIMYVNNHGMQTGILRAFTAVPAHAIFGIVMGYYLGLARFAAIKSVRINNLFKAFLLPLLLHGLYDFILFTEIPDAISLFIPLVMALYYLGFKKIKEHSDNSVFKNAAKDE